LPPSKEPADKDTREIPDKCPNCGKRDTFVREEESGEMVCSNCGFVLREKEEETGPAFSSSEGGSPQITSGPPTSIAQPDMGLETVIGNTDRDASGSALPSGTKSTVDRMRVWDRRSQPNESAYRNMSKAFDEIKTLAAKLSVGDAVIERSAYIYRKAIEKHLTRGRPITQLSAAALYAACRDMQIPRSLTEVAEAGNISRKDLSRAYNTLVRELDIRMPVEDPVRSVPKIGSAIGVSPRTIRRAQEILRVAEAEGISAGDDPMGLAGAALYIASHLEGEGKTQKSVAKAAEVTEVTVRNRYKALKSSLKL
jgi:transcription initiation factor TFIIB